MTDFRDETFEMLKSYLGRDVSQEVGSCRDYMDVYNLHIEDLRELVRQRADIYATKYIRLLLGKGGLGNAKSFTYYVVKDSENIDKWLRESYKEG